MSIALRLPYNTSVRGWCYEAGSSPMDFPVVALLTDFGQHDIYVGVMKGVMHGICPQARFIDLTHAIAPQNVRQAALALCDAYAFFPLGTVFLVVVDPGVGGDRRALAVQAGGWSFVAPDNGALSYALLRLPGARCVELRIPPEQQATVSRTFHGRDVFAPAAARLAAGAALASLGAPAAPAVTLPLPLLAAAPGAVTGEALHIDRFGNVAVSIGRLDWQPGGRLRLTPRFTDHPPAAIQAQRAVIAGPGWSLRGIHPTYSAVPPGELLALVSSAGWLELAVNQGSAADRLRLAPGDPIHLTYSEG